jgi:hypothetical protein
MRVLSSILIVMLAMHAGCRAWCFGEQFESRPQAPCHEESNAAEDRSCAEESVESKIATGFKNDFLALPVRAAVEILDVAWASDAAPSAAVLPITPASPRPSVLRI